MIEGVDIRPYRDEDIADIGRVHANSRRAAYVDLLPAEALDRITAEGQEAYWRARLAREPEPHCMFVLHVQGIVAGFVLGTADGPVGTVNAIHLLPDMHGSGAGQAMHDRVLEEFRSWGCESAMLWVLEGNGRAQAFYRRNGWSLDGDRDVAVMGGADVPVVSYRRAIASMA